LGVTVVKFVLQTTPEKKPQALRSRERAVQIPLLILLSPKTSDSLQRHTMTLTTFGPFHLIDYK
jgi:hypothetical protein